MKTTEQIAKDIADRIQSGELRAARMFERTAGPPCIEVRLPHAYAWRFECDVETAEQGRAIVARIREIVDPAVGETHSEERRYGFSGGEDFARGT